jgi:hypothetical protein
VIVAMVLGIVGVAAKGLLYLLFIGIAVFLGALLWAHCGCGGAPGGARLGNPSPNFGCCPGRWSTSGLTILKGGLQNGVRSRQVLATNRSRRPGRYCIRLSRVFTSSVSRAILRLARLAGDRLRCDQTPSTGLSSGA